MSDLKKSSGYNYLQETKFKRSNFFVQPRPVIRTCPTFKKLPDAETVVLPRSWPKDGDSIWELLQRRRSKREFSGKAMNLTDLARLFWAMQGITAQTGSFYFRSSPSAGALYPIETYAAITNVDGVKKGIYHFNPAEFCLENITYSQSATDIARAALDQEFIGDGAATFIWTAVFRRNMSKYGHRGGRYICMDAAHICHSLLLAAESIGRSACPVAAFFDEEINEIIQVDGEEESAIYMAVVG